MKLTIIGLAFVILIGLIVRAEQPPDSLPPRMSLEQALQIAQTYVRTNKFDTSEQYLAGIVLRGAGVGGDGKLYWEASWMHTNPCVKGGFFLIRVHMDKTVTLIGGQ